MQPLRVAIADDEPAARMKLRRLLEGQPGVAIVGEATNGRETIRVVSATKPDLLLLDVRMPDLDGFEAIAQLEASETPLPMIIFVTAYDTFALQAFEVRAFDYLLKPYDATRLAAALSRARRQLELEHRPSRETLASLALAAPDAETADVVDLAPGLRYLERLCIRSVGRLQYVPLAEVEWIEAFGNYVRLHQRSGRTLARITIRGLLARLDPARFTRIHRSAIVNVTAIASFRSLASGDALVTLNSGMRLRVSRSYRPGLDAQLGR